MARAKSIAATVLLREHPAVEFPLVGALAIALLIFDEPSWVAACLAFIAGRAFGQLKERKGRS